MTIANRRSAPKLPLTLLIVGAPLLILFLVLAVVLASNYSSWHKQILDTFLWRAVMQDDVPRTEALLSQGANVNSRQENRILLVAALVDNHLGTARVLLRFHPDVNAVNPNSGLTALECACAWGAKDIVETLVARDADINAHAVEGTSALSVAAHGGRADLVSYLLAHGAYIHLVDSHGKTPLMVTQRRYDDTLDPKKKARIFSVLTLLQKAENEKPLGP